MGQPFDEKRRWPGMLGWAQWQVNVAQGMVTGGGKSDTPAGRAAIAVQQFELNEFLG